MQFTLTLPDWAKAENLRLPEQLRSHEERMRAVLRFARLNFEHDTGGPFAAGVFERDTGKVIVIGVNRVVASNCSCAHAEIVAISLAQQALRTWDLGGAGMPALQLVVNWRPCAMCFGATLWSGVRSLLIAGSGQELEKITGFDEGPVHPEWERELEKRGIELITDVCRDSAIEVFERFSASRRVVYNARSGA